MTQDEISFLGLLIAGAIIAFCAWIFKRGERDADKRYREFMRSLDEKKAE
jgi:hypothetical protein